MVIIFSLAIVLNAALLFLIQPMVAKMILPWLGGSPAVWNTSLVFYQACLLAGYGYAHLGSQWLGARRHALVHLILLVAALLLLPIKLPIPWFAAPSSTPAILMLAVLTVTIGFPFFVLSGGAPLLQKWFAHNQRATRRDPYFLYAASNTGSIAGLLAYPLLLEPKLTLSQQNYLWFCGYWLLIIMFSVCIIYILPPRGAEEVPGTSFGDEQARLLAPASVNFLRRLRWVVWSFVPLSLLMGVTSYVTTDIASMPLLWVLPLSAYLLSFVIAFARVSWATSPFLIRRQAIFLLGAAITVFMHATEPLWIVLPLHLISFFVTALICHGQLAQDRPDPSKLTDYYFWISLGGVLGGAFNALIAPLIFKVILEYPLAIAAAAFLRPYVGKKIATKVQRRLDWILPPALVCLVVVVTLATKQNNELSPFSERLLLWASSGVICLSFAYRPVRFGIGLLVLTMVSLWYPSELGNVLYADRSFFGAYLVTLDQPRKKHVLFQGTTIHVVQSIEPQMQQMPMAYYYRTGPAGQVLLAPSTIQSSNKVAVVGLSAGALTCHGTPARTFTFYEIDPLVEKIARNVSLFTYLRDCPAHVEVVIGDARVSLIKAPDRRYDIFILDAFSSDVIPVHLLTREAVESYLTKTAANGLLLFHISNRYLDLAPVLARLATDLNLVALIQNDTRISSLEAEEGKLSSRWVILARGEKAVEPFLKDERWHRLDGRSGGELWTDEFSNIVKVISWR